MDQVATIALPVGTVFAHLADPARLGDWLPQIVRIDSGLPSAMGVGTTFTVTVHTDNRDRDIDAEIVAYEPSWQIGYRFMTRDGPLLLRATCTANDMGTRLSVRQTDGSEPLLLDLAGITETPNGDARSQ